MTAALEYDFIVIGGGTAGLVVAARLSENPNVKVLVLEAGENHVEDPRVKTPLLWQSLGGSDLVWPYEISSQAGLHGRKFPLYQGRVLGGSSAVNATLLIPPSKATIDSWGELGNHSWNWESLKPYFSKIFTLGTPPAELRNHLKLGWIDEKIAGPPGPIQASFVADYEDPISSSFIDTVDSTTFTMTEDIFSGKAFGAFRVFASVDGQSKERSYSATSYYAPATDRKNLQLLTGCTVEKIILSQSNQEPLVASEVHYRLGGELLSASAKKEIILAAGAFGSPKLLELSGVGDSQLLQSLGIDIHVENPSVGENLQDHLASVVSFEAQDHIATLDDLVRQDPSALQSAMVEYMTTKSGPLTSSNIGAYAFLPISDNDSTNGGVLGTLLDVIASEDEGGNPQYQSLKALINNKEEATGVYLTVPNQFLGVYDTRPGSKNPTPIPGNFITVGVFLPHPFSRGSSHIASADPQAAPTIDPKYLSHPIDIEVLAHHLQHLETIVRTGPFSDLLKPNGRRNDERAFFNNLDDAREYARNCSSTIWHPSGTCAMSPREKGGVVDHELVVYGTSNLRVVDASIMPVIPRGNIQATVYAVAERAADMIKARYSLS